MRAMAPLAAVALATLAACSTPRQDAQSKDAAPVLERWATPAPASTYVAVQHDDRQVQPAEYRLCNPGLAACPAFSRKVYDVTRATTAAAAVPAPKLAVHRIYFAVGSSALDDDARAAVTALLPQARAGRQIVVEGRTDPRGSRRANERLAAARANSVRAALLAGGVPAERVQARAAEPCCDGPLPSTESDYAGRRRASVSISITSLTNKDS